MKYKMMKVFDCQDMPEDVRKAFFEHNEAGNDCTVSWYIHSERYFYKPEQKNDPEYCEYVRTKNLVDDWLIANGAKPGKSDEHDGEHVLVKHWW